MRVLCHAQALQGVGHFVRMQTIARALARTHDVYLVHGSRPVPRPASATEPHAIALPVLARSADGLQAAGSPGPATAVLAARAHALAEAAAALRPDVVLIDHYPFSKWDLEPELEALIVAARDARPGVRIVCSLRDLAPQTRHETVSAAAWERRVTHVLRTRFDAVLVHGDPGFARLEDSFAPGAGLDLPVHHTGFVTTPIEAAPAASGRRAVLSCGGGDRSAAFLARAIHAFRRLHHRGTLADMELEVFPGAFDTPAALDAVVTAAAGVPVRIEPFSADFAGRLAGATLSIGRAGYNTTAELLQARVRTVVVPDPRMSDQGPRARRLAAVGLATLVEGDPPDVDALAAAIGAALAGPRPEHTLDLAGAAATAAILERLHAQPNGPWPPTTSSASRSTPA